MGNVESVLYRNYNFDEMKEKHLEKIRKNTNNTNNTNKQNNICFLNKTKNYNHLST